MFHSEKHENNDEEKIEKKNIDIKDKLVSCKEKV